MAEVKERIGESVDVGELYDRLAAHGLAYGPHFRTVRNLMWNGAEILAELEVIQGPSDELEAYRLHPALLDGAIQTLVGAIGQGNLQELTYLPAGLGRVVFHAGSGAPLWTHGRVTNQSSDGFEGTSFSIAWTAASRRKSAASDARRSTRRSSRQRSGVKADPTGSHGRSSRACSTATTKARVNASTTRANARAIRRVGMCVRRQNARGETATNMDNAALAAIRA